MKQNIFIYAIILFACSLLPSGATVSEKDLKRGLEDIDKHGRLTEKGERQLLNTADLIVVGTVVNVNDLNETNSLNINGKLTKVRGVETMLKISKVLRGILGTNSVVLHHYRLESQAATGAVNQIDFTLDSFMACANHLLPPGLVNFTPNSTNEYELYLAKEHENRFIPASGQSDASFSVRALPPPWDFSYIHWANPDIRETYIVTIPTNLLVSKVKGVLKIRMDRQLAEETKLSIGTNMLVGIWCDVYVYEIGDSRPTNYCHDLEDYYMPNASEFNKLDFQSFTYYWRPDGNGIAERISSKPWIHNHEGSVKAGTKYTVEINLTLFETSAVIHQFWNPDTARYYRVLWRKTLNQVVE